jgi:hypothetical protein
MSCRSASVFNAVSSVTGKRMVCWTGFMMRLRQECAKHSRKMPEVRGFPTVSSPRTLIALAKSGGKAGCTRA